MDRGNPARRQAEAATLIGSGKVEEIRVAVKARMRTSSLFDHDLTPTQQRNLERLLDVRVIDRTQLILDIFAAPRPNA